jgi:hypothetical protein
MVWGIGESLNLELKNSGKRQRRCVEEKQWKKGNESGIACLLKHQELRKKIMKMVE